MSGVDMGECLALTLVDVWRYDGLDDVAIKGGKHSNAMCTFSVLFLSCDKNNNNNNARKKPKKAGEKSGHCVLSVDGICHKKSQFDNRGKTLFCPALCSLASWLQAGPQSTQGQRPRIPCCGSHTIRVAQAASSPGVRGPSPRQTLPARLSPIWIGRRGNEGPRRDHRTC